MIAMVARPGLRDLWTSVVTAIRQQEFDCAFYETTDMYSVPDLEKIELMVLAGVPCGADEMDRMPRLRGIVSPVLGFNWIDVDAATQRRIVVTNSEASENREGMAEATILLLLALHYRLKETETLLRENHYTDPIERHLLKGRTIGIIGFGGITRAVLDRLAPWGCQFLIASRRKPEALPNVRFVSLDDLLQHSDAILVLTKLDSHTYGMLGAEQFAKVRPGALLVNTARGGIVNEAALIEALKSGQIGAAALDVFEHEPLDPHSPLRDLPNVILTPHAIGHNEEGNRAIPLVAAENVRLLAEGKLPASCKNPDVEMRRGEIRAEEL